MLTALFSVPCHFFCIVVLFRLLFMLPVNDSLCLLLADICFMFLCHAGFSVSVSCFGYVFGYMFLVSVCSCFLLPEPISVLFLLCFLQSVLISDFSVFYVAVSDTLSVYALTSVLGLLFLVSLLQYL